MGDPHNDNNIISVVSFSIGTLGASQSLIFVSKLDQAVLNARRLIIADASLTFRDKTTNEGPLLWGYFINMTANEIELLIAHDPQDRQSVEPAVPQGSLLMVMGIIPKDATAGPLTGTRHVEATIGAPEMERVPLPKRGWTISEGKAFGIFVHNFDGTLLTTGTTIEGVLTTYDRWVSD